MAYVKEDDNDVVKKDNRKEQVTEENENLDDTMRGLIGKN